MAEVRLLLDEDVPRLLAESLRARDHDVVHATEVGLKSIDDSSVLARAVARDRTVLTHNAADYIQLAALYGRTGKSHHGIVIARQESGDFRWLLRETGKLLIARTAADLRDAVVWLPL